MSGWYAIRVGPDLYERKTPRAEPSTLDHARRYTTRGALTQSIARWKWNDDAEAVEVNGDVVTVIGRCADLAAAHRARRVEAEQRAKVAAPLRNAESSMHAYRRLSGTAPCSGCGR